MLDRDALRVAVMDTSGVTRRSFPLQSGLMPVALACSGNEVYVGHHSGPGGGGRVDVYSAEGSLLRTLGTRAPDTLVSVARCGVAVHDSLVYVSDPGAGKILIFRSGGGLVRSFGRTGTGAGQWSRPGALAITDDGRILVGDDGNQRVQEYGPDGTYVTQFGRAEVGSPAIFQVLSMAVYSSSLLGEYIYAANYGGNCVTIVIRRYIRAESRPVPTRPGA